MKTLVLSLFMASAFFVNQQAVISIATGNKVNTNDLVNTSHAGIFYNIKKKRKKRREKIKKKRSDKREKIKKKRSSKRKK